jgi:(E)-4-hydroxy-3-methylbut-2-enyl-diphosphate synthase
VISRKKTRVIKVGNVLIGGNNPISIQSMANTDTRDVSATVHQILELEKAGCDIIRAAVPDEQAAYALKDIRKRIHIPLVADIHFDYRLAVISAKFVDKLRINPGNIGSIDKVKKVVEAAKKRKLPIRIGVNLGSLNKESEKKFGLTAEAMVDSGLKEIKVLENLGFRDIAISLKASDILTTIKAYELFSSKSDYPLHIGITEAGTKFAGTIKSSIGIGSMLLNGIGDTIRVSLTDTPIEEVFVGKEILTSLGLKKGRIIISCPTCGRTQIDLISIAKKIEEATKNIDKPIKIAVMGCIVNGPGEAKEADIGIAGGDKKAILFKKGKIIRTIPEDKIVEELLKEIRLL